MISLPLMITVIFLAFPPVPCLADEVDRVCFFIRKTEPRSMVVEKVAGTCPASSVAAIAALLERHEDHVSLLVTYDRQLCAINPACKLATGNIIFSTGNESLSLNETVMVDHHRFRRKIHSLNGTWHNVDGTLVEMVRVGNFSKLVSHFLVVMPLRLSLSEGWDHDFASDNFRVSLLTLGQETMDGMIVASSFFQNATSSAEEPLFSVTIPTLSEKPSSCDGDSSSNWPWFAGGIVLVVLLALVAVLDVAVYVIQKRRRAAARPEKITLLKGSSAVTASSSLVLPAPKAARRQVDKNRVL